jgi:hypothetical protein
VLGIDVLGEDGPLDQRREIVHAEVTRCRRHVGWYAADKMLEKARRLVQAGGRVLECPLLDPRSATPQMHARARHI